MTWKELKDRIKLIKKHEVTKEQLDIDLKRYTDLTNACVALSEATKIGKEVMENFGKVCFEYTCFINFAKENRQILIDDYTRQAIL